ncbi:MAG: TspO/MBR family protein [Henriciella sp.]|nr:tryptophan-rich sensory protein [Hyphomonadaceae bacterium]
MSPSRPATLVTIAIAIVTAATAGLGAAVSGGSEDVWYYALEKPGFTPPDILFAIVWPILFVLMALGAILVRIRAGSFAACSAALGLYFTQLALNLSWSWLFFGFHEVLISMVVLVALWLMIAAMIRAFAKHSVAAAVMQVPYLLWVSFAGYLNLSILLLNQ